MAGRKKLPYTVCAVDGCETLTHRRLKGIYYCRHHLHRIYAFGEPEPAKFQDPSIIGVCVCRCCEIEKPISSFKKHKHSRFGVNTTCHDCTKRKIALRAGLNKILIPTGAITEIPTYRLANPKIPSVKKKKTYFFRKDGCRIEGCQNRPRPGQAVCAFHRYLMKNFGEHAYPKTIECSACSKDKSINEFMIPDSYRIHSLRWCGSCSLEKKRKTRRNIMVNRIKRLKLNPQKYQEYKRKRNQSKANRIKNNPIALHRKRTAHRTCCINRRARKQGSGGTHTQQDIQFLFDTQKGQCVCCRESIKNRYHIDHIIPIALGGGSEKENLQLLCPTCNTRKCAKHPIDFMQENGYLL